MYAFIYVEGKSVCDYEIAVQSSFFIEVLHPLQIEKSLGYFSGEISEGAAEGGVCSFNKKIQSRNHYVQGCGAYQKQKKPDSVRIMYNIRLCNLVLFGNECNHSL